MKTIAFSLVLGFAAFCAAQEAPTLEELQAERQKLLRELDQTQAEIEKRQGPVAPADDSELKDWQRELEAEFDEISKYLDEVPQELSKYFSTMQKALGDLLTTIDEGFDESRENAREKISAAERAYRGARETAYNQDRLHDLRTRAGQLGATEETAPLIQGLEQSLAEVDRAQANAAAAEAELDRARQSAEIAGRKLETRLMEIETRKMEEALQQPEN